MRPSWNWGNSGPMTPWICWSVCCRATMVSLAPPTVRYEPLGEVVRRLKTVATDSDTVRTARDIGISFGDR